jgi:TRAP-type mannitol/chloroaromatic compound transport system permease small subunit
MTSKLRLFIKLIDTFIEWTGKTVSWLVLGLVLLICYDVAMRYLFQQGSVALQELEWHLFALIFLLGSAYTLKHDEHVRVDIIYQSRFMSDKKRAFVENAFYYNEGSPDPGGLPYRFLLKGSLLVAFGLLILQALADLARNVLTLSNNIEVK